MAGLATAYEFPLCGIRQTGALWPQVHGAPLSAPTREDRVAEGQVNSGISACCCRR